MAEIYQVPAIAVDTHVERIAKQFKMVSKKATPLQVEEYLEKNSASNRLDSDAFSLNNIWSKQSPSKI
ncbi:hypothetical protein [Holzapfeliella floricola]|uniref:hypothetical protein n=1 Tax=Holzapfeliella floricola TaxID=679249 RepID=UPI003F719BC8